MRGHAIRASKRLARLNRTTDETRRVGLEPGLCRLRDPFVLHPGFKGTLRHGLAAAGVADAKNMGIRCAVDAIEQRGDFPDEEGHIGILVARPNGYARLFSAGEYPKHVSIQFIDGFARRANRLSDITSA